MKKISINKGGLQLKKEKITSLMQQETMIINGGGPDLVIVSPGNAGTSGAQGYYTSGCTDGCSPAQTAWRCTLSNFTADCTSRLLC